MDFMSNPTCSLRDGEFDFSMLGSESYDYLKNSNALFGLPIDRLAHMNQPAIDLYTNNGIDLHKEYLEIAVCAQHNNGGLRGNIWWESNVKHLFPVGEVNGTFGVYRPGGSALNSTQVGSFRAAQFIAANYTDEPMSNGDFVKAVEPAVLENISRAEAILANEGQSNIISNRVALQTRMTKAGAHIRSLEEAEKALSECVDELEAFEARTVTGAVWELVEAFRNRDILVTQIVYLKAIIEFIKNGGRSRGSYLVSDEKGILPLEKLSDDFKFTLDNGDLLKKACVVSMNLENSKPEFDVRWEDVRPIPSGESWFENVWSAYRRGEIIK